MTFLLFPSALIIGFCTAIGTCLLITPWVIALAFKIKVLDQPDERRIHQASTPRLGGIAIYLAVITGLIAQQTLLQVEYGDSFLFSHTFLIAGTVVFLTGLVDDIFGMRALIKLIIQSSVAMYLFYSGVQVHSIAGLELPFLINFTTTVVWFLLIVNAYNLIDGFDGLASGLACIGAIGIAGSLVFRHLYLEAAFILPLVGACLSFLRFNRSPARIFLGDSGSLFIGFYLAWISLATVSKGPALASIAVPFLAFGVPLFDLLLAVWRRSLRKMFYQLLSLPIPIGIMSPDLEHVHHRFSRLGLHPRNVAATLYLLNCLFVALGIGSLMVREVSMGIYALFFFITAILTVRYIARVELKESRIVLTQGFQSSVQLLRSVALLATIEIVGLLLLFFVATWATYYLYYPLKLIIPIFTMHFPSWVLLIVIGSMGLRMYYQVRKFNFADERLFFVDCMFTITLLCIVSSIVSNGYQINRTLASYYFPMAALFLLSLRAYIREK